MSTLNSKTVEKLRGALWGMFVADALAMPVHWYYNTASLKNDYGEVREYVAPKHPHPDSILWRSDPKISNAKVDILGDQRQFYGQRGTHYHRILKKGENTLNLQVVRLFLRSVVNRKGYDPEKFLEDYIQYMLLTPNKDTYAEVYHREFFENYGKGLPPLKCAGPDGHDTASAGGFVALLPALLFHLPKSNDINTLEEKTLGHLRLTHTSKKLEKYARAFIQAMWEIIHNSSDLKSATESAASKIGLKLESLKDRDDKEVLGGLFSTACYIEDSFPSVLYLAHKYPQNIEEALIVNTNRGGDNCHRGAILGALIGSQIGEDGFPKKWIDGLAHKEEIRKEIDEFVEFVTQ